MHPHTLTGHSRGTYDAGSGRVCPLRHGGGGHGQRRLRAAGAAEEEEEEEEEGRTEQSTLSRENTIQYNDDL